MAEVDSKAGLRAVLSAVCFLCALVEAVVGPYEKDVALAVCLGVPEQVLLWQI
jgi:hypothetical protein